MFRLTAITALMALCASAQSKNKDGEWPSYAADLAGTRYRPLDQINAANFNKLEIAWRFKTDFLGSRPEYQFESTPLMVNGVLYFTVPDNVWAVDARTGHQIWHYTYKANEGMHLGHRGVAMYKQWLYFSTPDAHLISLEAKNGKVRWDVVASGVTQKRPMRVTSKPANGNEARGR